MMTRMEDKGDWMACVGISIVLGALWRYEINENYCMLKCSTWLKHADIKYQSYWLGTTYKLCSQKLESWLCEETGSKNKSVRTCQGCGGVCMCVLPHRATWKEQNWVVYDQISMHRMVENQSSLYWAHIPGSASLGVCIRYCVKWYSERAFCCLYSAAYLTLERWGLTNFYTAFLISVVFKQITELLTHIPDMSLVRIYKSAYSPPALITPVSEKGSRWPGTNIQPEVIRSS